MKQRIKTFILLLHNQEQSSFTGVSDTMLYFGYGSNLNIRQMENRCPDAEKLCVGHLPDHRLVFRGVADVEQHDGARCPGGLWEISERDLEQLDRYEGYPRMYDRYRTEIEVSRGATVEAIVYDMNEDKVEPPNSGYFNTILEGYQDFGIDTDHLIQAKDRAEKELGLDQITTEPGRQCHAF